MQAKGVVNEKRDYFSTVGVSRGCSGSGGSRKDGIGEGREATDDVGQASGSVFDDEPMGEGEAGRKHLASYFEANGYRKIAIYGMSYAGETLLDELKGTGVQVAYAIDRSAGSIYADVDVLPLESELGDVDAVVVTAITYFDEVEEQLGRKLDCPVVSLENILYEM